MSINLGRYISDLEIQGFKTYNNEKHSLLEKERPSTYINMSEIGTKIDPGNPYFY